MSCNNNYRNVYNFNYHTPAKWRYNSEQEIMAAEEQQELAQRLILEADRLVNQTKESVVKNKLEIDHQSKVKVKDIEFKCREIETQKYNLDEEIELLVGYQTRIENANKSLVGDALDVIAECLKLRNCRISIDLVFDDVEKELLRERELILGINDQLEDLLDKVVLQIRKLRAFVYSLAMDLRYKQNTLKIEAHNEKLDENSIEISILNNHNLFKPAIIPITEWNSFTSDIISAANKVLVDGRPIRAFFDKTLSKMIEDLVTQSNAVDQAIKLRVDEYREVIEKLNTQRVETIKKIGDVELTINQLKKAIKDKEAYIALVHTRLLNRNRREGVELCRDELEAKLYDEVTELENNVQSLQRMMTDSMVCLRHLKQSTIRIDLQLEMKENSMRIDNELCAEQRKRINYHAF